MVELNLMNIRNIMEEPFGEKIQEKEILSEQEAAQLREEIDILVQEQRRRMTAGETYDPAAVDIDVKLLSPKELDIFKRFKGYNLSPDEFSRERADFYGTFLPDKEKKKRDEEIRGRGEGSVRTSSGFWEFMSNAFSGLRKRNLKKGN